MSKSFAPQINALDNVTLHVGEGELLALVGPSGCGKTTLLRLIAGLEKPSAGTIRVGERDVTKLTPSERGVGMVFQRPALYPHKTVRDNLAFSLKLQARGWRRWWPDSSFRASCQQRVQATSAMLGLESLLDRFPGQLSGGQQQRVALGRVLVRQPGVILLDEPLSNLDSNLRHDLRRELHLLQRQLQATMICVTHDPLEALSLGDRVAVLEQGRLQQVDRAEVFLQRPANRFVAGFVAWPPMNFVDAEIQTGVEGLVFVCCEGRLPVPPSRQAEWGQLTQRPLKAGIRPKDVRLSSPENPAGWPMQVRLVEPFGLGKLVTLTGKSLQITALLSEGCQNVMQMDIMATGKIVMVQMQLDNVLLFDRASGAALSAVGGTG